VPAMWGNAFNEDDPLNAKIAADWGIVMGYFASRADAGAPEEWKRHGTGSLGLLQESEVLRRFSGGKASSE